jgi:hypothetical protein
LTSKSLYYAKTLPASYLSLKIRLILLLFILPSSDTFSQINLGFTELVNSGLSSPVEVATDGSSRLFIVEQTGAIRIYNNGALEATPFINLAGRISCCGERGLLSIVFHPQYSTNGFFYVYYTATNGAITVERFKTTPANANVADPATGKSYSQSRIHLQPIIMADTWRSERIITCTSLQETEAARVTRTTMRRTSRRCWER